MTFQGELKPDEAIKNLAIFEGKFGRLKEERDNVAKAKEALELAEPGNMVNELLHIVVALSPF